MFYFIVYSHPKTDGHAPIILEEVKKVLQERGDTFEVLDLYAMSYDPVLHENEHYTSGGYAISEVNTVIREKILNTKKLIFIHPIWWYSMPAILKGFLDKVFTSRYAFSYDSYGIPHGLLKGRKALVLCTSGSPWFAFWHPGMLAARQVLKQSLQFCGISTKVKQLWGCGKFTPERMEKAKRFARNSVSDF